MPVTNRSADAAARELVKNFFNHSYLPRTIVSDLTSTSVSELTFELTRLLEIEFKHATIGVVERLHGPLKRILKINSKEQWNDWQKYVPLGPFIHSTSYRNSMGCCPTTLFRGHEPVKPLYLRFYNKAIEAVESNSDFVTALQDAALKKFSENKLKFLES